MEAGRLSKDRPITMKDLEDNGVVTGIKHGVKLLARDSAGVPFALRGLQLEVTRASAAAKAKVRRCLPPHPHSPRASQFNLQFPCALTGLVRLLFLMSCLHRSAD